MADKGVRESKAKGKMENQANNHGEGGGEKEQYWFKPKEGSVFPAKKKSVKMMMVERAVGVGEEADKKDKHKTYPGHEADFVS
ncbi:hypothetical protein ACSBR2_001308 [Camellia fascicularis]